MVGNLTPSAQLLKTVMKKLTTFHNLTYQEAYGIIHALACNELTDAQIAGFLVALLMKGPTIDEIAALARAMRDHCKPIRPRVTGELLDTCGTGGGLETFNVSTANAIAAAAAGIPVAKHGSRSISGRSGSADVLEALGVEIDLTPEQAQELIERVGVSFLYAPNFHPVMNRVWGPENQLGIKTIFFTIMGPLINPADARRHILGVYKPELVGMIGEVLAKLNFKHALVVHGVDGYDEISLVGKTMVAEVKEGKIERYEITPEELGFRRCSPEDIGGGSPEFNAKVIRNIFEGKEHGPKREFLMLNLAGALYVGGKVSSLADGAELAKEIIDSGKAQKKLEEFVKASKEVKGKK